MISGLLSRATAVMPYLPPEIWLMIISYLNDQDSLFKLCQVSKTLHEIATPQLYENPDFTAVCGYTIDETFQTLTESPHLAQQVKKLRLGFDNFSVHWDHLTPAVEDVFNRHIVALLTFAYYTLLEVESCDYVEDFLKITVNPNEYLPDTLCRSVLVSLLPNVCEMRVNTSGDLFLASVQPDALTKLKKVVFEEDHDLKFKNLNFLAEAAPNLESLAFINNRFTFQPSWNQDFETLIFPAVTNLNLDGVSFADLETASKGLVLSFPVLQSLRFHAHGRLDSPRLQKIESLLLALRCYVPRLKHFCLKDTYRDSLWGSGDRTPESEWSRLLKIISSFTSIETLSIDDHSLWPFKGTGRRSTSLVDCLPESLHHLHLEHLGIWGVDTIYLVNTRNYICTLARAISEEGKFSFLKKVSFSSAYTDEDLSETLKAVEQAGVSMVRQESPWGCDGLYMGK